jgi:hypothetical protein
MYVCMYVISGEVSFNIRCEILFNIHHKGIDRATAQLIRRWLLTAEPRVQSQLISCEYLAGRNGTGVDQYPSLFSVFPS